jgi:hypothetical protein
MSSSVDGSIVIEVGLDDEQFKQSISELGLAAQGELSNAAGAIKEFQEAVNAAAAGMSQVAGSFKELSGGDHASTMEDMKLMAEEMANSWASYSEIMGASTAQLPQMMLDQLKLALSLMRQEMQVQGAALSSEMGGVAQAVSQQAAILSRELPTQASLAVQGMTAAIGGGSGAVSAAAQALVGAAHAPVSGLSERFGQAGANAGAAFAQGLSSQTGQVAQAAGRLAEAAAGALGQTLEIRSPSKVFMELGAHAGDGFLMGMGGSLGNIAGSFDRMMAIIGDYSGRFSLGAQDGLAGGPVSNTTNNQTIHFNQPVSSPYQVARQVERTMQEMLYGT